MRFRFLIILFLYFSVAPVFAIIPLNLVQISSLQDFNFGAVTLPFSTLQKTDLICLYDSGNPPTINVVMTGLHDTSTNFQLANSSSRLTYNVELSNTNRTNYVTFSPGRAALRRAQNRAPTCNGINNLYANLRITVPSTSFSVPLTAGTYTDTLTIMIGPE